MCTRYPIINRVSELKVHIELTRFVQPEKIEIDANERAVNEKSQYCFFVCTTFDSFLNDLPLSCICIFGSILKILLLKPLLFFLILRNVNSLYLKYHRSCTIIATGNHHSLIIRPPMHDGTTLQCGINISADSIPCFATELSVHQMIKIILLRCPCEPHMAKVTCFQTL